MEIELHQIDAFTDRVFAGNPAAVCPLDSWPEDDVLAAIAAENNLSETAFLVPETGGDVDFQLRWFTPTVEVDLCGHATLASGHYLLTGPCADRAWPVFRDLFHASQQFRDLAYERTQVCGVFRKARLLAKI